MTDQTTADLIARAEKAEAERDAARRAASDEIERNIEANNRAIGLREERDAARADADALATALRTSIDGMEGIGIYDTVKALTGAKRVLAAHNLKGGDLPDPEPGHDTAPGASASAATPSDAPGARCCDNGFFGETHDCMKGCPAPAPSLREKAHKLAVEIYGGVAPAYSDWTGTILAALTSAASTERERCARIAQDDAGAYPPGHGLACVAANRIVAAIRESESKGGGRP